MYFYALEGAVSNGYLMKGSSYDKELRFKSYGAPVSKGEIFTLSDTYNDGATTFKTDKYWYCFRGSFYGTIASSEKDEYKDLKVPENESNSSIAPADLKAGKTITELDVNVDWSKVPELTVGSEIGEYAEDMPEIPEDAVGVSSSKVGSDIRYYWAVKATEEDVSNGYLSQQYYDACAEYDHITPLFYFDPSYEISENATYYCYAYIEANKGYAFTDKNGENVSDIVKSNLSGVFALASGEENGIVQGTDIAIFLKLGTPAEIEYNRNNASPSTPEEKGYTFDESTGKLVIQSDDGMTAWKNDCSEKSNKVTSIKIQSGVTQIPDYVFFKYGSLKSVIIPETVKTIGEMSFANCDVLTDVTIATGVTSIGTAAFVRCALESITIPASVTEIGADAFYGIGTLKEVKVEGTNPASIGGSAFGETWFVTNGEKGIKVPAGTVDTYKEKWSDWANYIDGSDSGSSGSGNLNSETKADEDSPIKDASLTNSKEELLGATGIFTDAEKQLIESGKDAKVWMQLDKVDLSTISVEDQTAINEKAKDFMGSGTELTYFDASLFKQIEGQSAEKVAEPGISMKLTIKIPTELITNDQSVDRTYSIIRLHNGTAEKIGGTFNKTTGEFSFETDKFSTYAIAYKDTAKGSGSGSSSTGSSSGSTTVNTTFKITTPASTEGGTITASKSGEISKGDTVTYTITPAEGYEIKDVLVDGKSVGAVSSYTFTNVTEAHTISAVFVKKNEQKPNDNTSTVTDQSKLTGSQIAKLKLPILLAQGKAGKNQVTLNWLKAKDADGYDVYWSYCDGGKNYKKLATVKNGKLTAAQKKLTNGKEYKYFVAAYKMVDGKKVYTAKSNVLHVATLDSKQTNAKSISVNKTNVVLNKNKTFTIKAQTKLENSKKAQLQHAAECRYYTSNAKVAKVSSDGVITAKGAGSCTVYVLANNGAYKKIKVTVK